MSRRRTTSLALNKTTRADFFEVGLLFDPEDLLQITVPSGYFLGVYSFKDRKLICSGKSVAHLRRKLKIHKNWPTLLGSFSSRRVPRVLQSENRSADSKEQARGPAPRFYRSIASLTREAEESGGRFLEALRLLDKEAFGSDVLAGDKPTAAENQRMIDVLKALMSGDKAKEVAPAAGDPLKRAKVLMTQLRRFCLRAFRTFSEMGCPRSQLWELPKFSAIFKQRCGFDFDRGDMPIAREAVKRGSEYAAKQTKHRPFRTSGSASQL